MTSTAQPATGDPTVDAPFTGMYAAPSRSPGGGLGPAPGAGNSAGPARDRRFEEKVEAPDMQGDSTQYSGDGGNEFELDMKLVEYGPVAAALLGSTDDGCDTVRGGDC